MNILKVNNSASHYWFHLEWQIVSDKNTLLFTNTHPLPQGKHTPKIIESKPLRKCEPALFVVLMVSVPQRSITSVHHNRNQWVHNSETNVHEAPKWEWNTMHYCVVVIHYHCANSKVKHQKKSHKLKETRKCFVWENRQSGMGSKHPCLLKNDLIVGTLHQSFCDLQAKL